MNKKEPLTDKEIAWERVRGTSEYIEAEKIREQKLGEAKAELQLLKDKLEISSRKARKE